MQENYKTFPNRSQIGNQSSNGEVLDGKATLSANDIEKLNKLNRSPNSR